jgi:hypothetical protein
VLLAAAAGCGDDASSEARRDCGTKELHGRELRLHVVGKRIPCSEVREIVRGECRDGKVWSCFSFRPPDPILVWFPERERFKGHYSTAIEARRYPCSEARVTRRAWAAAQRKGGFPSRLQVLADDLMRCRQLKGMTYHQVRALLGRTGHYKDHGRWYLDFMIGDERDSFFQVDSESFVVEFGRDKRFRRAYMVQN